MIAGQFHRYDVSHLAVLVLAALIAVLMIWRRSRWMEQALAIAVFLSWPVAALTHYLVHDLSLENALPFHLCDVAALAGAVALWKKRPLACELVYFFGLAGTLQGLITPNLQEEFPSPRFFSFFLSHCGVVIAALYVVLGLRFAPRAWAVGRMEVWLICWAVVTGLINSVLHTNYGFLCAKPPVASLMDVMGPWPWYIVSLAGLAAVFFVVLDLPFMGRRMEPELGIRN